MTAQNFLLSGNVLCQPGILLCNTPILADAPEQHTSDVPANCILSFNAAALLLDASEPLCTRTSSAQLSMCMQSNDYGVIEIFNNVMTRPYRSVITLGNAPVQWDSPNRVNKDNRSRMTHFAVRQGVSSSIQKCHHRAIPWIVIKGTAEAIRGRDTFILKKEKPAHSSAKAHHPETMERLNYELSSVNHTILGESQIGKLENNYGREND
ncbi:hypothetical protein [Pseudomonas yamanorum]|uniref:hypothetical protein n=1 Tax=Pseudomonas yamanorum TaxID=515393 RepID=UPI003D362A24